MGTPRTALLLVALLPVLGCGRSPVISGDESSILALNQRTHDLEPRDAFIRARGLLTEMGFHLKRVDPASGILVTDSRPMSGPEYGWSDCGEQRFHTLLGRKVQATVVIKPEGKGQSLIRVRTRFTSLWAAGSGTHTVTCMSTGKLEDRILDL